MSLAPTFVSPEDPLFNPPGPEPSVRWARSLLAEERPQDIRLGLERLRTVLQRLGDPQDRVPGVLVAGTNGKGSTCAILDSIVRATGARCALYTSPHLIDWPERLRFDGQAVPWPELAAALARVEAARAEVVLTTFERLSAAAFLLVADRGVDLAVYEVGLGGRLDATRVLRPCLSLITPIGLDHMELLGPDLASIAREKAGILEQGVPALSTAGGEALGVLAEAAERCGSPFFPLGTGPLDGLRWLGREIEDLAPPLLGAHQHGNLRLAASAALTLDALGLLRVSDAALRAGVAAARWPGRLQLLAGPPDLLLDGAHNPHAAEALALALDQRWPERSVHLVFGQLADKDAAGTLGPLAARARRVTLVRPAGERGRDPVELLGLCEGRGQVATRPLAALLADLGQHGDPHELILLAGSLRLVGEALACLPPPWRLGAA